MYLGQPLGLEESKYFEFKEITGKSPMNTIKDTVKVYAVAFLNSAGGHILWGVRNSDGSATGVRFNVSEKDELKRLIHDRLATVDPQIHSESVPDHLPSYT